METKGFLGSLFDLSFTEFITTRLVQFIYILAIILAVIVTLMSVIAGFGEGFGRGLLGLIISPVVFLLIVLYARITLELVIVVFRIAENTGRMANGSGEVTLPRPPSPAPEASPGNEPPVA